ncbi:uncharacterized protein SPPG_04841 [Spizellomyces punctatus DAOM BR117]|uniref:DUF4395 domain-containing protein n=1 Tax=Spizellomyces punctatus (strain DAOM BR117) TaxID=645134 RepID=A0A0L0HGB7_SPIPD|nr:uncharacterized protein SPPG_04841 [Spizellomyces punctatus DAOM BR117]KND00531.1 hypothetical protein SPPG_04841 [Spizellomyces punctatus DAOM BR117]|eukprot:XP_016608570.1 hypothetical protein SPPG_04841 [Spizellomyces punctatus DAOM BR117]
MAMTLFASLLPPGLADGGEDERWHLVKIYQAVDIVWGFWIINSVFGKCMQHYIKTGISSQRFGDKILVWLTAASFVHFIGRIVNAVKITPWYIPVQLFWDRFYLVLVLASYGAIAAKLYATISTERSHSLFGSCRFLAALTGTPMILALIAQCVIAAHLPRLIYQLEVLLCGTMTMAFIINCVILNIARRRTAMHFQNAKARMTPLQDRRQTVMLRKLNLLYLFTISGSLTCAGFVVRLIVFSPAEIDFNFPKRPVQVWHAAVMTGIGILEMVFLGISAATAADLFEVSDFTATSPFLRTSNHTGSATPVQVTVSVPAVRVGPLSSTASLTNSVNRESTLGSPTDPAAKPFNEIAQREYRLIEEDEAWTRLCIQTAEEQAMWWKNWRSMTWKEFTTFPNPINEAEVRIWITWAFIGCTLGPIVDIYWNSPAAYWTIMTLAFLRAMFGFRLDPLGYINLFILKPLIVDRWGWIEDLMVAGPPRKLALVQPLPLMFAFTIAWHLGWVYGARWIFAIFAASCAAQAMYDVCLGCAMFWVLIKLGIANENACEVCTANYVCKNRMMLSKPAPQKQEVPLNGGWK